MDKPIDIIILEDHLQQELFLTSFKNDFIKLNKSYDLDSKGNIIALNLQYSKISDLKYIANFVHLKSLHLGENNIRDISGLSNLKNLEYLNLEGNNIVNITDLKNLIKLRKLILEKNSIWNITPLGNLQSLSLLNINRNSITNISTVSKLKNLNVLYATHNTIQSVISIKYLKNLQRAYFSNNCIEDISPLKGLSSLQEFFFQDNMIFDLSPIYPLLVQPDFTRTHNFYDNPLVYPPMETYLQGNTNILNWFDDIIKSVNRKINECIKTKNKSLKLSYFGLTDLNLVPKIFECTHIETLILSNEWADYKNYEWSKASIKQGSIRNNLYEIPNAIGKLKNLKCLIIGGDWSNDNNIPSWRIKDVGYISKLYNLEILNISNNEIASLDKLKNLGNLKDFHFNNNYIKTVFYLGKYPSLKSINASNNYLKSLNFLKDLEKLEMLDIHSNHLNNIDELEYILKNLKKLVIDSNPIIEINNWKLDKYENHLSTILNYFSKKVVRGAKEYILPVKVLLLGNHASGKSTLLDYLISSNIPRKIIGNKNSTHIIRIEQFKQSLKEVLPKIIYFDFGGQDYYHGIYKAFLTNDAINILLWTNKFDYNTVRKDINGLYTRDFTKEYWINQLKYYYSKSKEIDKTKSENQSNDVALIVQTHGDQEERISFVENVQGLNIINQFYIALNQKSINEKRNLKINLDYFESILKHEIEDKRSQERFKVKQPIWYFNFLKFIFSYKNSNSILLSDLKKHYLRPIRKHEKAEDIDDFFIDDLDQLHRQGLILYYKDFIELNDVAWLNPSELTKHIHKDILSKNSLSEKFGDVDEITFKNIVSDDKIIKLLQLQKVIFYDKDDKRFIIPSFLQLANELDSRDGYDLLTFGFDEPNFVLKFENFIPFGIVNQMICHFGNNPDSKYFWRDQLIFTLRRNVQVLIRLDFNNLEVFVYVNGKNLKNNDQENILSYIYNCILAIYNDTALIDYNAYVDFKNNKNPKGIQFEDAIFVNFFASMNKLPDDLFISVDNRWFVKGHSLSNFIDNIKIPAFSIKETSLKSVDTNETIVKREISSENSKELFIYKFQSFTNNKLTKLKKIFISYSKDDLKLIHEFQDHLSSLKREGSISSWYCTELIAGGEWDKEISRHFDEADIACFMVSPNFMRTDYIYKYEISKAIERKKLDTSFTIVPIILDFCSWNNSKSNLGMYTALPYTAKPICDFDNRNMAWYIVVECIRFLINNYSQPEGDDWYEKQELPKDIKKLYERIVEGLVDKK